MCKAALECLNKRNASLQWETSRCCNNEHVCECSSSSNDIYRRSRRFSLSLCLYVNENLTAIKHNKDSHWWRWTASHVPTDLPQTLLEVWSPRETGLKVLVLTWGKGSRAQWKPKTRRSLWDTGRLETRDETGKTACECLNPYTYRWLRPFKHYNYVHFFLGK